MRPMKKRDLALVRKVRLVGLDGLTKRERIRLIALSEKGLKRLQVKRRFPEMEYE